MAGLFRIILIVLLIWHGIKFLLHLLFPSETKRHQRSNTQQKEGEVTIHHDKKHHQHFEQKEEKGEYVDYEEVK